MVSRPDHPADRKVSRIPRNTNATNNFEFPRTPRNDLRPTASGLPPVTKTPQEATTQGPPGSNPRATGRHGKAPSGAKDWPKNYFADRTVAKRARGVILSCIFFAFSPFRAFVSQKSMVNRRPSASAVEWIGLDYENTKIYDEGTSIREVILRSFLKRRLRTYAPEAAARAEAKVRAIIARLRSHVAAALPPSST